MEWIRVLTSWDGHPKTLDLPLSAKGLWLDCAVWVGRHETDGRVPAGQVHRIVAGEEGRVLIDALVEAGLWTVERHSDGRPIAYHFHDWLEVQTPKAAMDHQRAKGRERIARWKDRQRNGVTNGVSNGLVTLQEVEVEVEVEEEGLTKHSESLVRTEPHTSLPVNPHTASSANLPLADRVKTSDIEAVWAAWVESTGKTRSRLDPKRRELIRKALGGFGDRVHGPNPVEDVIDAVRGWERETTFEDRPRFNDVKYLLRDQFTLEKFRDYWRDGPPAVLSRNEMATARNLHAFLAKGEANGNGIVERHAL